MRDFMIDVFAWSIILPIKSIDTAEVPSHVFSL